MAEAQRLHKPRTRTNSTEGDGHEGPSRTPAHAPAGPTWAAAAPAAPFALGGVQRKVAIGASNDIYEREANSVAGRVASGQRIAPGAISSISPASLNPVGQRQAKPEEKKKDQKPVPVQREVKPEDKTKDAKSVMPVQRADKPAEKKKDEKPPAVQRQAKPEEKKKDEKPPAPRVQRAAKPEERKKEEKPPVAPLQRESKTNDKKKDEKSPAPPVQRNVRPEDKKKIERDSSAPIQKQGKPEEKKKDEKSFTAPVQREEKPQDKKKDEKPAAAPVQRESKPADKKNDEKALTSPVQRADKSSEKKKDEKPAAPIQREAKRDEKKKEDKPAAAPVQRMEGEKDPHKTGDQAVQTNKSDGAPASTPSMESAASHAISTKGPGEPLHSSTRSTLESGLGSDLSDVRVHNDSSAQSAAEALNARAFTHQSDIWLGHGESQHNLPLMAHEATHVIQQTGSVHRQLVQTAKKDKDDKGKSKAKQPVLPSEPVGSLETGLLDPQKKEIHFSSLDVPAFKATRYAGKTLKRKANYERNDPDPRQREVWKKEVDTAEAVKKLKAKAKKAQAKTEPEHVFTAKTKYGSDKVFFGDPEAIAREMTLASWDQDGKGHSYDVDHILELQLANWSDDKSANTKDNMELLDSPTNQKSGLDIADNIEKKVKGFIAKEGDSYGSVSYLKRKYAMVFDSAKSVGTGISDKNHWTKNQIEAGDHIGDPGKGPVKASDPSALGKKGEAKVFPSAAGGSAMTFHWPGEISSRERNWLGPFKLIEKKFDTTDENSKKFGSLKFEIPKKGKRFAAWEKSFDVERVTGARYAGYIDKKSLREQLRDISVNGLSPIEVDELDISEKGLQLTGRIMPEISLLKGTAINFEINGQDIRVYKTFDTGNFKVPKPLNVTDTSLTISAGTESGLTAEGEINFAIDRVGSGFLRAKGSIADGLELTGQFDFDSKTFKPATLTMHYQKGEISLEGHLGIPEGKVRGIKQADITASYAKGVFQAAGTAELTVPGIEKGTVEASYSETDGFVISGSFVLTDKVPGISGGLLSATVKEKEGNYSVSARGEATPKIPGINSKLVVTYDDGLFDASITAEYEKGMLKGAVTVGATNRPVGDDAKPSGRASDHADKIIVYGGGSVTLKLAPWLQAIAAIKFTPNGEVEVTGQIGLPNAFTIFDEKKVDKNIFKIGIDIPIFGFSVLGQHVGIFLNVGGGLDVSAGIGPGMLQDANLSVTYNPAHEEDTKVHGHAALHIPAHAGLRLSVHAALGAGIPIVDAKAGIELGGSLGVEGAAHADVDVDWTPKKGLVLDASASIYGEPKFKFDITGYVLVEADLFIKTITLYEKKWQLAAFEYGSGLRLGLKMPIHYEEGKPFNPSLSDIQFEIPHVDPMATLKGLIDKIV